MVKEAELLYQAITKNRKNKSNSNLKNLSAILNSIGKDLLDDCCLEGKI